MEKTLFGKNPDLDDVEFIQAVEAAFDIKFSNKELESFLTFGDVYDAVCRHVQPVERGEFPCLSASAYRHINNAIAGQQSNLRLRPSTPLSKLAGNRSVSDFWLTLKRETNLRLPELRLSGWSVLLLAVLFLGAPLIAAKGYASWWIALVSPVLGIVAVKWLPRYFPVRTVGDLARSVAALNARALSQPHDAIRTRDAWSSLVWIAQECTGFAGPIKRETILIG